jgi:hypothetical protein
VCCFCFIPDEETGFCINGFRVSIRRRWNYENNVSAVVCYVSTGKNIYNIYIYNIKNIYILTFSQWQLSGVLYFRIYGCVIC